MLAAAGAAASVGQAQVTFYFENFNSAVLNQPASDPACPSAVGTWTDTFPTGWIVDDCGVPTFFCRSPGCATMPNRVTCATCTPDPVNGARGVLEWEGWAIASKDWWISVAGDQTRSQFTLASGNVAVADCDEWDDQGDPDTSCGYYNAFITTPSISLSGVDFSTLNLALASSWRPEARDDGIAPQTNNQTGTIRAIYDMGGGMTQSVQVLRYESTDPGVNPFYKADAQNEQLNLGGLLLGAPAGAQSVRFEFSLTNAANDWWWAIDNIVLTGTPSGGTSQTLFSENFDGATLRPPADEAAAPCATAACSPNAYTRTGPNGVSVAVDGPLPGPAGLGVVDWRGWSFTTRAYWNCVSGGNGSGFLGADNVVAVADGDEFDDLAHEPGNLDTTLSTPSINISTRSGDLLALTFKSSWRFEAGQVATISATFQPGGQTVVIDRWDSLPGVDFKPDAINEVVGLPVNVPAGATSVVIKFNYNGGNNWWWAIDDIRLFEGSTSVTLGSFNPFRSLMALGPTVDYTGCTAPWAPTPPLGWTESFVPSDALGNPGCSVIPCGREEWQGWAFPNREWWGSPSVDTQLRETFTRGVGRVAVADPDEWDDRPNGLAQYNAFLTSPSIALPAVVTSMTLNLDSSWRPEAFDDTTANDPQQDPLCVPDPNAVPPVLCPLLLTNNQTAIIKAIYTLGGGSTQVVEVLNWNSGPEPDANAVPPIVNPNFKPDAPNENVNISITPVPGATSVRFEFSLTKARNDWWWAIDNLNLSVNGASVFTETFEGAQGGTTPPTEAPPVGTCFYFSEVSTQGNGFSVDDTLNTGCATAPGEFNGWGSWYIPAWGELGGGRQSFLAETGFISDFNRANCDGTTDLITPNYPVANINLNTLSISFRSSWFSEPGHVSRVDVRFDGGAWVNILNWNPSNKTTNFDEVVTISNIATSSNGQLAQFRFRDVDSGWWAVSDLLVTGVIGVNPPSCVADFNGNGTANVQDLFDFLNAWFNANPAADINNNTLLDVQDIFDFLNLWFAGC